MALNEAKNNQIHDPTRRGSNASSAMDVCPEEEFSHNSSSKGQMSDSNNQVSSSSNNNTTIDSSSYNFSSRRSSKCSNESGIHSLKLTDSDNQQKPENHPVSIPQPHLKISKILSHLPTEVLNKEKVDCYVCEINPAFTKSPIFSKNPINKYVMVEPKNIVAELQPIVELYWTKKELDKANYKINKIQSYFNSRKQEQAQQQNEKNEEKSENLPPLQNAAKRPKLDNNLISSCQQLNQVSTSPSDELNVVDSTSKNSDSNQGPSLQENENSIQSPEGNTTSSSEPNMLKSTATKQLEDLIKFQRQSTLMSREDMLQGLLSQIQVRSSSLQSFAPNSLLGNLASGKIGQNVVVENSEKVVEPQKLNNNFQQDRGSGIASLLAASRQLENNTNNNNNDNNNKPKDSGPNSVDFLRSFTSNRNFPAPSNPNKTNNLPSISALTNGNVNGTSPRDTQIKIKLPGQINHFSSLSQLNEGSVTSEAPSQTALPSNFMKNVMANSKNAVNAVNNLKLPSLASITSGVNSGANIPSQFQLPPATIKLESNSNSNSNSNSQSHLIGNSSSSASQSRCSTSHSMNNENSSNQENSNHNHGVNCNHSSSVSTDGSSGNFKLLKKTFPPGMTEADLQKSLAALDPENKLAYLGPCEHCGVNLGGLEDYKTHMRKHYFWG